MKKTLIALAVAGALTAPAAVFAQAGKAPERAAGLEPIGGGEKSEVVIYGRANLGIDSFSATGATAGSAADFKARTRVYDAASRLGVRGTKILDGGYKGIFLIESGVNFDTGNQASQSGATNISTGFLASRIANVGLVLPGMGQITFGRTNVWWSNGTIEQTGANYLNTGLPMVSGTFGRGVGVGISRVSNLFQYITPVFANGTYAAFSYSPNGETTKAGDSADGKLYAVSVEGAPMPFQWGIDLARSSANTYGGSNASPLVAPQVNVGGTGITVPGLAAGALNGSQPVTTGLKLRAAWWYAPNVGKIAVIWNKGTHRYGGAYGGLSSNPDPTSPELSQASWNLSWEHRFGKILALAQWGKLGDIKGCVTPGACRDTNATSYLLGARYSLAKDMAAYVSYNATRNAANYNLDYIPGGISSAAPSGSFTTLSGAGGLPVSSVGADPRVLAVGLWLSF